MGRRGGNAGPGSDGSGDDVDQVRRPRHHTAGSAAGQLTLNLFRGQCQPYGLFLGDLRVHLDAVPQLAVHLCDERRAVGPEIGRIGDGPWPEVDVLAVPLLAALHDRVANRPRIKAYLASKRRIAFSQWGIYRYFKELDA